MSLSRRNAQLVLVALCSLAVGAGASVIAGAGAATGNARHAPLRTHAARRAGRLGWIARHAAQGTLLLATRSGFRTVSFDRGLVGSVSGRRLTLLEGNPRTAQRTIILTVPSGARIRDDRRVVSLSALTPGQRVIVLRTAKRAWVLAHTVRRP